MMVSLDQVLAIVASVAVIVFSVGSMLAVGLASPVARLIEPLRRAHRVFEALLANFVVVPALAIALVSALTLDRSVELGILLVAMSAGTPFLLKLMAAAQGDAPLSATLLVLLLPVTILYIPIILPLVAPEAVVSPWALARPLVLTMLLPLGIGLTVRTFSHGRMDTVLRWLARITTVALVVLILASVARSFRGIPLVGVDGLGAAAILILGGFATGYALSTLGPDGRLVLGLGTAQRNIAAATVVATQALGDPITTLTVVLTSLVGLAILFPIAWWFRKKSQRREPAWPKTVR